MNPVDATEYVAIYNAGDDVAIDALRLDFFNSSGSPNGSIELTRGTFMQQAYIVFSYNATPTNEFEYQPTRMPQSGGLELTVNGALVDKICWGSVNNCSNHAITLTNNRMIVNNRLSGGVDLTATTFTPPPVANGWLPNPEPCEFDSELLASDENCVMPTNPDPDNPPPTDQCANLSLSEIGANLYEQFVEVINPTDEPLSLAGCGLATNRNDKVFTFGDDILAAGAARTIKIADSGLALSKTVSGTVYLLAADGSEIGNVTYPEPKAGTSYAFINDEWQIVKNPTPDRLNTPEIVNDCAGLELSEVAANVDEQFIEIANATTREVNLTGCQLMTNRNNAVYEFAESVLVGGGYLTVNVKDTPLTLTKTTTGTVYLLASDGVREVDSATYANLAKDTSWALVDGAWRQTYALTTDAANAWIAYPSCPTGQERNLETGRCRKIIEPEILAACPAGQYRNPETNRCKKYDTGSTLTPCKEGYERNPLTNRCRKIVVEDDDGLKPCAEGWERNPETNRCRKKVSTAPASFAVQPGDPTGGGATYMLASAGVIAATLGIVLFQFRMEIANLARKLRPKLLLAKQS
jgi:hypothetical protein